MADLRRVKAFLKDHPHLELMKDSNGKDKVRCKLTNHELPCSLSAIESYTKGKKYQRLTQASHECYKKYNEFLVPHKKKRNQLFCQLTKKSINNIPHHIEQHVTGKRFTKALAQFKSSESKTEDEDTEMWVPSDLESDSELENEQVGDETRDTSKTEESAEENEDIHCEKNGLSSDEQEESVGEELIENDSSKARCSKPAKRKNKQEKKRKSERNSDEITPSKKAKKEKDKLSSKKSERTVSETTEKKRKTSRPKETKKSPGKQKVKR